ncbi:MAG: ribonuclease HII [Acidimicrobiia bacterium]
MTTTVRQLRPSLRSSAPGLNYERSLWADGNATVVGIDEVGRGSWAGPLTVAAVVVPQDERIYKVRDSKQLTEGERESMMDRITNWAAQWSVGHAWPDECDALGMSAAQQLATNRALNNINGDIDHALVDGNWDFVGRGSTTTIVKGDAKSLSIAAASIVAKVTRDRLMREAALEFPWYSFESNKGYPCHRHRAALALLGPSVIHRTSWAYMSGLPWSGIDGCGESPSSLTLF